MLIQSIDKSTNLAWVAQRLTARGVDVVLTREPGDTPRAEAIRELLLDMPVTSAQRRLQGRLSASGEVRDRFEQERSAFFEAVRSAYLERASGSPQRMAVIDADAPLEVVQARLAACLEARVTPWL
ncbi:dTMP kinase [Halomonas alkalisoli]|uniref:dTMP kinase n=1 Tax=Halomonas alkalisoli TaxID=2907158 RepID=UPI001F170EF6|nr:hypothetical protein [Halomonas alkalisoli]